VSRITRCLLLYCERHYFQQEVVFPIAGGPVFISVAFTRILHCEIYGLNQLALFFCQSGRKKEKVLFQLLI
jgi:hypothetical protein